MHSIYFRQMVQGNSGINILVSRLEPNALNKVCLISWLYTKIGRGFCFLCSPSYHGSFSVCFLSFSFFFVGPRARTQVCPTIKNFTPRHPAQAWETRKVQPSKCNEGLASGALPSWSQLLQCIVSMTDQAKSRFYTNPSVQKLLFYTAIRWR